MRSYINTKAGEIGYVEMWVYGSDTLLTQADRDFRNQSYRAMVVCLLLAVILAAGGAGVCPHGGPSDQPHLQGGAHDQGR